jgi:xanthine dehydrogenase accessory factor
MADFSFASPLFNTLVLIRGAGRLGSSAAYRLVKAGFPVIMTELPLPLLMHTTVSYGAAVLSDTVIVEGVTALRSTQVECSALVAQGLIPVIIDPGRETLEALRPPVVVDARSTTINFDTTIDDAVLVIGLGSGFTAGVDCHVVIETNRGHSLGRVHWHGQADPQSGKTDHYVLCAPADGAVRQFMRIGEYATVGTLLARVGDVSLIAPFDGVLRGLVDDNVTVSAGSEIAEIDPHANREDCYTISDRALAVGGAVVEAALSAPQIRQLLRLKHK